MKFSTIPPGDSRGGRAGLASGAGGAGEAHERPGGVHFEGGGARPGRRQGLRPRLEEFGITGLPGDFGDVAVVVQLVVLVGGGAAGRVDVLADRLVLQGHHGEPDLVFPFDQVLAVFAEIEADNIKIHLETYIEGEMENMLKFGVAPKQIHFIDKITKDFQDFIDLEKLAGVVPGVPTGAALKGTNRRLKLKHGPRRPSFQDTGTMEASLLTWIE